MRLLREIDIPPLWLALAMGAAWLLARAVPAPRIEGAAATLVGWLLIGGGLALALWAAATLGRLGTPLLPRRAPTALATEGPFRFTRNPIYLADAAILAGWIALLGTPSAAVALPLFIWLINRRFIPGEEAALRAAFPQGFDAWSARVRRWL